MKYKCIKDYKCNFFDEDEGLTDKEMIIKNGRIFETTDENFSDAEIHLIDYETGDWIGVPREVLKEYFEEIKED